MSLYDRDYMRDRRSSAPGPDDDESGGGKRPLGKALVAGVMIAVLVILLLGGARCF
jgi:hypothetical protein